MKTKKILVEATVEVPEDAQYYCGDLLGECIFYKCTSIGVVGDHWWQKVNSGSSPWKFIGHYKPNWMYQITDKIKINC